jgi:hypothetical protein
MRNFINDLHYQMQQDFVRWFMTQVFSGRVPNIQEISQWYIQAWPNLLLQMPVWMRQTLEMGSRRWGVPISELWGGSWYSPQFSLGMSMDEGHPYDIFTFFALHPDGSVPYPWNPAGSPLGSMQEGQAILMPWASGDGWMGGEGHDAYTEELQRLVFQGLPREWWHPQSYPD